MPDGTNDYLNDRVDPFTAAVMRLRSGGLSSTVAVQRCMALVRDTAEAAGMDPAGATDIAMSSALYGFDAPEVQASINEAADIAAEAAMEACNAENTAGCIW